VNKVRNAFVENTYIINACYSPRSLPSSSTGLLDVR
jgi:hypothetical protein